MKFIFFALIFFSSCTSQTRISTNKDVKIYVDGDFKARGDYELRDNKIILARTEIKLVREGCEEVFYTIKKDEKVNYKAVAGFFLLLPLLWSLEYQESRHLDFNCVKEKL